MRNKLWKWLGVAGVAGVAATGAALVARGERERRAYTPEDIRTRLHERAVRSAEEADDDADGQT